MDELDAYSRSPVVYEDNPVPPLATDSCPVQARLNVLEAIDACRLVTVLLSVVTADELMTLPV